MKKAIAIGFLAAATSLAAAVDWPSDFDANLAARIAAITPSGSAVGTVSRTDQDLAGRTVSETAAGTELLPLDFLPFSFDWSDGVKFNSMPPSGMIILFR